MTQFGAGLVDYILHFIQLSFGAFGPQTAEAFTATLPDAVKTLPADDVASVFTSATNPWGSLDGFKEALPASVTAMENADELSTSLYAAGTQGRQFAWQAGWTTFYWAWWIAFSPFVGLFLARISKGRTVREFIFGCVIAPALVCFLWMTILGGTAIDLELSGVAEGSIIGATNYCQTLCYPRSYAVRWILSALTIMCVVLIMTFLVTSADSGILVMNTIMSGGQQETGIKHRIIWGLILTSVIAALIIAGNSGAEANPFSALQNAMIIGALPFTIVMVLMVISLIKALYRDSLREKTQCK